MSENQYNAPAMEVIEFDKEDAICTSGGTCFPDSSDGCWGIGQGQTDDGGGA